MAGDQDVNPELGGKVETTEGRCLLAPSPQLDQLVFL